MLSSLFRCPATGHKRLDSKVDKCYHYLDEDDGNDDEDEDAVDIEFGMDKLLCRPLLGSDEIVFKCENVVIPMAMRTKACDFVRKIRIIEV